MLLLHQSWIGPVCMSEHLRTATLSVTVCSAELSHLLSQLHIVAGIERIDPGMSLIKHPTLYHRRAMAASVERAA